MQIISTESQFGVRLANFFEEEKCAGTWISCTICDWTKVLLAKRFEKSEH